MDFTYFLVSGIIAVSLILIFFDQPLVTTSQNSIDCHSVSVVNVESNEGLFTFNIRIASEVEYPTKNTFSFLSIDAFNRFENDISYNLSYDQSDFINASQINDTDFSFKIYHQIAGESIIHLKCKNSDIYQTKISMDKITNSKLNTTVILGNNEFLNICYKNFNFFATLPSIGNLSNITIDNCHFPFKTQIRRKGFLYANGTSFLIPRFGQSTWKQILFQITPFMSSMKDNYNNMRIFSLFKNGQNVDLPRFLKPRTLTNLSVCFEKLIISDIMTDVQYEDSDLIENALLQDFTFVRSCFKRLPMNPKKIAISADLKKYYEIIEKKFPDVDLVVINESMSFVDMAMTLNDANALIGTKIGELIGQIFLNNEAFVIDLQKYRGFCSDWAQRFANSLSLKYISYEHEHECECGDFSCAEFVNFDERIEIGKDDILDIISQLLL